MSFGILNGGRLNLASLDVAGVPVSGGGGGGGVTAVTGSADISAKNLSGDVSLALIPTSVVAGSYTSADIIVDGNGRITSATNGSGGGGGVSSVAGTANQIAASGTTAVTLALAAPSPAPSPATYTNATITVDGLGRVTAASNGTGGTTSITGTANQIVATATTGGYTLTLDAPSPAPTAQAYANPSSVTVDGFGRVTAITAGTAGSSPILLCGSKSWTAAGTTDTIPLSANAQAAIAAAGGALVFLSFADATSGNLTGVLSAPALTATPGANIQVLASGAVPLNTVYVYQVVRAVSIA